MHTKLIEAGWQLDAKLRHATVWQNPDDPDSEVVLPEPFVRDFKPRMGEAWAAFRRTTPTAAAEDHSQRESMTSLQPRAEAGMSEDAADIDAAMSAARYEDAVETLTEEGWIWDGDQWQRPSPPPNIEQWWLRHRVDVIGALKEVGLRIWSDKDHVWIGDAKWRPVSAAVLAEFKAKAK